MSRCRVGVADRYRRSLVGVGLVVAILSVVLAPAAAAAPHYTPPVDAPVVDPFRPPTTPYGPGHRGPRVRDRGGGPGAGGGRW